MPFIWQNTETYLTHHNPPKNPKKQTKKLRNNKKNKANQKPLKKQKKEINPHRNNEIDFHIYLFVQSHSYALCLDISNNICSMSFFYCRFKTSTSPSSLDIMWCLNQRLHKRMFLITLEWRNWSTWLWMGKGRFIPNPDDCTFRTSLVYKPHPHLTPTYTHIFACIQSMIMNINSNDTRGKTFKVLQVNIGVCRNTAWLSNKMLWYPSWSSACPLVWPLVKCFINL